MFGPLATGCSILFYLFVRCFNPFRSCARGTFGIVGVPEQVDATIPALHLTGASIPSDYAPVRILGAVKKKKQQQLPPHWRGRGPNFGGLLQQFNAFGANFIVPRPPLPLLNVLEGHFFIIIVILFDVPNDLVPTNCKLNKNRRKYEIY